MSDLISRQDAIRIVDGIDTWQAGWRGDAIESMKALPSAQPERCEDCENFSKTRLLIPQPQRKKGKWIEQDDSWDGVYYECSACGEPWTTIDGTPWDNGMKFCPNCGAEMREDTEEPNKCDTCKHEKEPWSMQCHSCDDFKLWEAKDEPS